MILTGRKTYILAGVLALGTAAKFLGLIDEPTYQLLAQLVGAGSAVTVGHRLVR